MPSNGEGDDGEDRQQEEEEYEKEQQEQQQHDQAKADEDDDEEEEEDDDDVDDDDSGDSEDSDSESDSEDEAEFIARAIVKALAHSTTDKKVVSGDAEHARSAEDEHSSLSEEGVEDKTAAGAGVDAGAALPPALQLPAADAAGGGRGAIRFASSAACETAAPSNRARVSVRRAWKT